MAVRHVVGLLAICMSLTLAGCTHGHSHRVRSAAGSSAIEEADLPVIARGDAGPDVSRAVSLANVDQVLGPAPSDGRAYRSLTPAQCQCLAVEASVLGNLFDEERRAASVSGDAAHRGLEPSDCLKMDLLATSALEARNQSAARSLEAYYSLAENEARLDLIERGLAEVDRLIEDVARVRGQGLANPIDDTEFVRQRGELVDQRLQLQAGIAQLNRQLWQLLGAESQAEQDRIWPAADLTVAVEPVDAEVAVAEGMAVRPELGLLRRMQRSLDSDSLDSSRAVLGQASGLLGLEPPKPRLISLLGLRKKCRELAAAERELGPRKRQLAIYRPHREAEVAGDIREAAANVDLRLRQVALAQEQAAQWDARLRNLTGLRDTGRASFAEVGAAQLSALQAQGQIVSAVAAWKIAGVKLKEAQGLLVLECRGL